MLILLSPAKKQCQQTYSKELKPTQPLHQKEIILLQTKLKSLSCEKLSQLMSISSKLAELNYQRYQDFQANSFTLKNAHPALYSFAGDAYQSLDSGRLKKNDIDYLQNHLIILSGLYGALRPMDLIQAYRLEMKTGLSINNHKNLYEFWNPALTLTLNQQLKKNHCSTIINLASQEYSKAINLHELKANMITVHFKQEKQGQLKTIGILAKRARGLMTRYMAVNKIDTLAQLQRFKQNNYRYSKDLSSPTDLVFVER